MKIEPAVRRPWDAVLQRMLANLMDSLGIHR
jgi:hypothetical protein